LKKTAIFYDFKKIFLKKRQFFTILIKKIFLKKRQFFTILIKKKFLKKTSIFYDFN